MQKLTPERRYISLSGFLRENMVCGLCGGFCRMPQSEWCIFSVMKTPEFAIIFLRENGIKSHEIENGGT